MTPIFFDINLQVASKCKRLELDNHHSPIVNYSSDEIIFHSTGPGSIALAEVKQLALLHICLFVVSKPVSKLFSLSFCIVQCIREGFHLVLSKSLPIPIHGCRLHGPCPQCDTTDEVGKCSSEQVWQKSQIRMPW